MGTRGLLQAGGFDDALGQPGLQLGLQFRFLSGVQIMEILPYRLGAWLQK